MNEQLGYVPVTTPFAMLEQDGTGYEILMVDWMVAFATYCAITLFAPVARLTVAVQRKFEHVAFTVAEPMDTAMAVEVVRPFDPT